MQNHSLARFRTTARVLAVTAAIAAGTLAACGIKGPLRLPPSSPAATSPASPAGTAASPSTEAPPVSSETPPADLLGPPREPAEPRKP
jgi:predicted small lipoprotein YifL